MSHPSAAPQRPPMTGYATMLEVFDMPASLAFYCDVLGFELLTSSTYQGQVSWALLERDGHQFMLDGAYEPLDRPPAPDAERVRHHADTAMYFWCEDLDAAHAFLVAHGVDARPPFVTGYGMRQLHFSDPDGYRLCLQHRAA